MQTNIDLRDLLNAYLQQLDAFSKAVPSETDDKRQQLAAMPDDDLPTYQQQLEALAQEQGCQLKAPSPPSPKKMQKPLPNTQPCRECQHFGPDIINPPAGLGDCREFPWRPGDPLFWSPIVRQCGRFLAK